MVMGYVSCLRVPRFRILAPFIEWIFFTLIGCKKFIVSLKRPKIKGKEAGISTFKKYFFSVLPDFRIPCPWSRSATT